MRHHYLHSPLQLNTAWENVDSPSKTVACSLLSQSRWKWDAEKEKQGGKGKNNLALYLDSRVKYCGHTREKFFILCGHAHKHNRKMTKLVFWVQSHTWCITNVHFDGVQRCSSWRMTDWMLDQNSTVHAILIFIAADHLLGRLGEINSIAYLEFLCCDPKDQMKFGTSRLP